MVGGAILYREVIQREISRVLVLNLSGEKSGASALHRRSLPLTEPSLLSRDTLQFQQVRRIADDGSVQPLLLVE